MKTINIIAISLAVFTLVLLAGGCRHEAKPHHGAAAGVKDERDKLSPEDRKLVDAQEWCCVSTDERLGEMGPPIKIILKDQPVFLCCGGCEPKAKADPERTLAKVEELKAKKRAEVGGK
jgi:hypothetical protein